MNKTNIHTTRNVLELLIIEEITKLKEIVVFISNGSSNVQQLNVCLIFFTVS